MVQLSPTQFVSRTNIAAFAFDACLLDLETKSVTKFYQNDFLPPHDSAKPIGASINTLQYNSKNDVLLIGTTSFPSQIPKGLRLVNMATKKVSPSFDFNGLRNITLFNNDKDIYIVGIKEVKTVPQEGGIHFIRVSR